MYLTIAEESPPLYLDESGSVRVGKTRVLLELVIQAYQEGATPEEISEEYDTLTLAEVYSVVAYYLRHREEVEAYVARQQVAVQEVRRRFEVRSPDLDRIRARVEARRERHDASPALRCEQCRRSL